MSARSLREKRPAWTIALALFLAACVSHSLKPRNAGLSLRAIGELASPRLTYAAPQGMVSQKRPQLTFAFNRPMVALSAVGKRAKRDLLAISPPLPGRLRWIGTRTLLFEPAADLEPATRYTASLDKRLRTFAGERVSELTPIHVETRRPTVRSMSPRLPKKLEEEDIATMRGSALDQRVLLRFDQPMSLKKLRAFLSVKAAPRSKRRPGERPLSSGAFKLHHGRVRSAEGKLAIDRRRVELTPLHAWPKDARVTVRLREGFLAAKGNLGGLQGKEASFLTYAPLRAALRCSPGQRVQVAFNNPVWPKTLDRRRSRYDHGPLWSPPRRRRRRATKAGAKKRRPPRPRRVFYGSSTPKPRSRHRVQIAGAIEDVFGQRYEGPRTLACRVGDYPASHAFYLRSGIVEKALPKNPDLRYRNEGLTLYYRRPTVADAIRLMNDPRFGAPDDEKTDEDKARRLPVPFTSKLSFEKTTLNKSERVSLPWRGLLGGEVGFLAYHLVPHRGGLQRGDGSAEAFGLMRVSDIAIALRKGPDETVVWLTSLKTHRPLANAPVELYDEQGKRLKQATTNRGGLALLPQTRSAPAAAKSEEKRTKRAFYVVAYHGADKNIVRVELDEDDEVQPEGSPEFHGLLFTDRGVYGAGDPLFGKVLVRREAPNNTREPARGEVELALLTPMGRRVQTLRQKLTKQGSATFSTRAPQGLGRYRWVLRYRGKELASQRVRVAVYRPARMEATASTDRRSYIRGDTIVAKGGASYLIGGMPSGAAATMTMTLRSSSYTPKGYPGFTFSDRWRLGPRAKKAIHARATGRLDKRGRIEKSFTTVGAYDGPRSGPIELTAEDAARQRVSARTSVTVHPAEFYVGVRAPERPLARRALTAHVVSVTPAGKPRAGVAVKAELFALGAWDGHLKRSPRVWVATCSTRTDRRGRGACRFANKTKPGIYIIRSSARDPRGNAVSSSTRVRVYGKARRLRPRRETMAFSATLSSGDKTLNVGDALDVVLRGGDHASRVLVSVEHRRVLESRQVELPARGRRVVRLRVTREMMPSATVSLVSLTGRTRPYRAKRHAFDDPGKPSVATETLGFRVSRRDTELAVQVDTSRPTYQDGAFVEATVQVRDHRGQPVRAEVTLGATDDGVLLLDGHRYPGGGRRLYPGKPHAVSTETFYDDLVEAWRLNTGVLGRFWSGPGQGGGGGYGLQCGAARLGRRVVGPRTQADLASTTYFDGRIMTNKSGRATVRFKANGNLTRFRLSAFAASLDGSSFGVGRGYFTVRRSLSLTPALPHAVRKGDRFEAGVVVHNRAGAARHVDVKASAELLTLGPARTTSVTIPAGGSREVRFSFVAPKRGAATLTFTARSGDDRDGLELPLPVREAVMIETVANAEAIDVKGKLARTLDVVERTATMRGDRGGLTVMLASSAMASFRGAMDALINYRHECGEQTSSRLIPLALLPALVERYGLAKRADQRALAARLIDRLGDLSSFKGMSFWPGGRASDSVSIYGALALHLAKQKGHPVPAELLKRTRYWLKAIALKQDKPLRVQAYAAAIWARVAADPQADPRGRQTMSKLCKLASRPKALGSFERGLVLSAISRAALCKRTPDLKRRLLDQLLVDVRRSERVARVAEARIMSRGGDGMGSNVRSTAVALDALIDVNPKHPLVLPLLRGLIEGQRERALNTQAQAFALIAMEHYRRVFEAEGAGAKVDAQISIAGRRLGAARFQPGEKRRWTQKTPMAKLTEARSPLALRAHGRGRLYYSSTFVYARKRLPKRGLDRGIAIERSYRAVDRKTGRVLPPHTHAKAGSTVRVRLTIRVGALARNVVLVDALPAGLEAIDESFATAAASDPSAQLRGLRPDHKQIHDDRVAMYFDRLPPGNYVIEYATRATVVGDFLAPPAHIEKMYEPDVFGRTGSSRYQVR